LKKIKDEIEDQENRVEPNLINSKNSNN